MEWTLKLQSRFVGHMAILIDETCDLALAQDKWDQEAVDLCKKASAALRDSYMPSIAQMQDLLKAVGTLTIRGSFGAGYALGQSPSDAVIPLFVDGAEQPLEIATPDHLLRQFGVSPKRAALVHVRFPSGGIPKGDIILVETGHLSAGGDCCIVTQGQANFLAETAAAAPYTILTCDYGIFDHCKLYRLAEEDGVTPIGRAITTLSGAPIPQLGEAQRAEFNLILESWQRSRDRPRRFD
jgi:hypothetical protein